MVRWSGTRSVFVQLFSEANSANATCLAALFGARVPVSVAPLRQAKLAVSGRWLCDTSTWEVWTQHQLRGFVKVHWTTQAPQISSLKPESKSETSLLVNAQFDRSYPPLTLWDQRNRIEVTSGRNYPSSNL